MMLILIGVGVGLVLALVLGNFVSGEKHQKRRIKSAYAIEDPQFARSVSGLLGPPLTQGNHVKTLINGSQIFPAMLQAIRGARRSIPTKPASISGQARHEARGVSQKQRTGSLTGPSWVQLHLATRSNARISARLASGIRRRRTPTTRSRFPGSTRAL